MIAPLQINLENVVDAFQSADPAWYQAASTVVLVLVTLYYSRILRKEVIRDRKQDHTNELRETVTSWIEYLPTENKDHNYVDGLILSDEFRPVPDSVLNDPYTEDFLDNHAPAVKELVEEIKMEIDTIRSNRHRFLTEFEGELDEIIPDEVEMENGAKPVEIAFYTIVTTKRLQERNDQSISEEEGIEQCVSPSEAAYTDAEAWWVSPYTSHHAEIREHDSIFSIPFDAEDYPIDMQRDQIAPQVTSEKITEFGNSIGEMFDDDTIGTDEIVSSLSRLETQIKRLRQQLERYRRQNIYSGYCPYITDSTFWLLFDKLVSRRIRRWFYR